MDWASRCGLFVVVAVPQVIAFSLAFAGVKGHVDDCDDSKHRCHTDVMPSWWSLLFQLLVLLVLLVALATGLDRCRTLVVALLATSTVTTMLEAQKGVALKINAHEYWRYDEKNHIANLLMSGFITMSVMNIVLMALVGISGTPQVNSARDESCPQEQQQEQQEGYHPPSPLAV